MLEDIVCKFVTKYYSNCIWIFSAGDSFTYSNFGYLLLGKIIETVSQLSYEQFVQTTVLRPAGIYDAQVGGDSVGDALPNEVRSLFSKYNVMQALIYNYRKKCVSA